MLLSKASFFKGESAGFELTTSAVKSQQSLKSVYKDPFCWRRGLHSTEAADLLLTQQPREAFPAYPKKFQRKKLLMLAMLINGAGERKMDSGLKKLIKPI